MRRLMTLTLFVFVANLLGGCTFIGMGIGAAVPRYAATDSPTAGDRVRVHTDDGRVVEGEVALDGRVLPSDGSAPVSPDHVTRLERRESNAGAGAAIGAALDVAWIVALVAAAASLKSMNFGGFPSWSAGEM